MVCLSDERGRLRTINRGGGRIISIVCPFEPVTGAGMGRDWASLDGMERVVMGCTCGTSWTSDARTIIVRRLDVLDVTPVSSI